MAFEQDPDCLPTDAGNQFAFDGLLDHQAQGPTCPAFRRIAAHHRDDALLLGIVENLLGSGSLLFIQGALQAAPVIAIGNLADRFRSQRDGLRDLRRCHSTGQQAQSQRTHNNAHLLHSAS